MHRICVHASSFSTGVLHCGHPSGPLARCTATEIEMTRLHTSAHHRAYPGVAKAVVIVRRHDRAVVRSHPDAFST